ncbi:MAG: DUF6978 family protein [Thermoleophilia bacterium]
MRAFHRTCNLCSFNRFLSDLYDQFHIYTEGYGDKWAYQIPEEFTDIDDPQQSLDDFMKYCNITEPPEIQRGLFF